MSWSGSEAPSSPALKGGVSWWRRLVAGHTAFQLYAHITWHTWRRVGCVNARLAGVIRSAILRAAERTEVHVLRDAVLADHVHLLISFRPSTRISDFVSQAKGGSAYSANEIALGAVRWSRGYFARSVGERELDVVGRYIAGQFKRHPDLIPRTPEYRPDPAL